MCIMRVGGRGGRNESDEGFAKMKDVDECLP